MAKRGHRRRRDRPRKRSGRTTLAAEQQPSPPGQSLEFDFDNFVAYYDSSLISIPKDHILSANIFRKTDITTIEATGDTTASSDLNHIEVREPADETAASRLLS